MEREMKGQQAAILYVKEVSAVRILRSWIGRYFGLSESRNYYLGAALRLSKDSIKFDGFLFEVTLDQKGPRFCTNTLKDSCLDFFGKCKRDIYCACQ
jgi:hypothetical protein